MKIPIHDVDDIMLRIYELHPPKSKEDFKMYNLLRKYIETNTITVQTESHKTLNDLTEKLEERRLEYIFSRKDIPRDLSKEYKEKIGEGQKKIEDIMARRNQALANLCGDLSIDEDKITDVTADVKGIVKDVIEINEQVPEMQKTLSYLVNINEAKDGEGECCVVEYLKSLNN